MAPNTIVTDHTGIFGPKKPVKVSTTTQGGATRNGGLRQRRRRRQAPGSHGCWLLVLAMAALAALGPAPAAASCQCGLLVMRETASGQRWTLGETVMEGAVRPADCRSESAEITCLNTCANTTIVLTGEMNLHVLPLRLSIETQKHICQTLEPRRQQGPGVNSVAEQAARSLPLGGFYRHCTHDWRHTGVVFPDRICCLQSRVVDCNEIKETKRLPFLTIFRKRRQADNKRN